MTYEELFVLLGLGKINGSVLQTLTADGKNKGLKDSYTALQEQVNSIVEALNNGTFKEKEDQLGQLKYSLNQMSMHLYSLDLDKSGVDENEIIEFRQAVTERSSRIMDSKEMLLKYVPGTKTSIYRELAALLGLGKIDGPVLQTLIADGKNKGLKDCYTALQEQVNSILGAVNNRTYNEKDDQLGQLKHSLNQMSMYLYSVDLDKSGIEDNEIAKYRKVVTDSYNQIMDKKEALLNYVPGENANADEVDVSDWEVVDEPTKEYSTRGMFDIVVNKLDKARSFTSSGQYNELLTMVKKMNESDEFKGSDVLDEEQKCVIRLLAIKSRINTYLKHKAVDGVKQNAYKKLAAVEELNEIVSHRLSGMDFKEFDFGGRTISKNSLNITYKQELNAYYEKGNRDRRYAPTEELDVLYKNDIKDADDRYPKATWEEVKLVDRCMCRIILGALANDNVPKEDIYKLEEQRVEFRKYPGETVIPREPDGPGLRR